LNAIDDCLHATPARAVVCILRRYTALLPGEHRILVLRLSSFQNFRNAEMPRRPAPSSSPQANGFAPFRSGEDAAGRFNRRRHQRPHPELGGKAHMVPLAKAQMKEIRSWSVRNLQFFITNRKEMLGELSQRALE
jgi:hypothetical protein